MSQDGPNGLGTHHHRQDLALCPTPSTTQHFPSAPPRWWPWSDRRAPCPGPSSQPLAWPSGWGRPTGGAACQEIGGEEAQASRVLFEEQVLAPEHVEHGDIVPGGEGGSIGIEPLGFEKPALGQEADAKSAKSVGTLRHTARSAAERFSCWHTAAKTKRSSESSRSSWAACRGASRRTRSRSRCAYCARR